MYKLTVYLRNTETGETGVYHDPLEYDEPFDDFIWADGNYACDCNRADFLYGKEMDFPCSGNIIVIDKIVRSDTGEIVYSETHRK